MPRRDNQKIKLMKIWEILSRDTDEQHPMSTVKLIEKLLSEGVTVERKALYEDIKTLNENGYEVLITKTRSNSYYVVDRKFDDAEIRILIDAIEAANFITEKKTTVMAEKVASLAGSHMSRVLTEHLVAFNTKKHTNESILYNVDSLSDAIHLGKKVSFMYFHRDMSGNVVYKNNCSRYVVDPIALVFSDENYYLVAISEKYNEYVNFRVDKMQDVRIESTTRVNDERISNFNVGRHSKEVFDMFGGSLQDVTFECDASMADIFFDRFGEDLRLIKKDNNKFLTIIKVQISPTFYSWCFTFLDRIKILSPASVATEYCMAAQKIIDSYK